MKKKLTMLVVGGIVTASTMGLGFNVTVASAAEKETVHTVMYGDMVMQDKNKMGAMDTKAMGDMMKNSDMQKHCKEMMKSPEMKAKMQEMMKSPEMQAKMQEMMMKSPEMKAKMQEMMKTPVEVTTNDGDIRTRVQRILDEYSK